MFQAHSRNRSLAKRLASLVSITITVTLLAGCSSGAIDASVSAPSTSQSADREAGVRGMRVCFLNKTDIPMSITPADKVNQKNADHIVGSAGELKKGVERCLAGWNSYKAQWWDSRFEAFTQSVVDVSVSVNIDGNYNALLFRGFNDTFAPSYLKWTTDQGDKQAWSRQITDDQELPVEWDYVNGQKFWVMRDVLSEYYVEYVVLFRDEPSDG